MSAQEKSGQASVEKLIFTVIIPSLNKIKHKYYTTVNCQSQDFLVQGILSALYTKSIKAYNENIWQIT
jgi:hypothetical protein